MKKVISWIWDNILFLETLFLLAFIPLCPKIPLLDVQHTWVYIRVEDFLVLFVLLSWLALLVKKKITFKTPLTLPILIFWIIGAISTLHGVLLVFPNLANVFPNVAFLTLVRHIEYMSLFFIGYFGLKDKRLIPVVIAVLVITLLGVIGYGFGQKYLGFPAYLTMNEEFAKGIPIHLSQLSRVPSTFAGHYDLAAYLVLIIPILASLIFGIKNWIIRAFLLATSFLAFILLLMTVSRVSFFVLFIALFIVLFLQKKKFLLFVIPIMAILALLIVSLQPTIFDRFKSTIKEADVLVDAKTGEAIGNLQFVPASYLKDKIILQRRVKDKQELMNAITAENGTEGASESAIVPFEKVPPIVPLVMATNVSTGENLPQGTGYINLTLSPVTKDLGSFYYELPPEIKASFSAQVLVLKGDFVAKKASAYDLSFTTRFQGEWPNAILAFQRNILIGSGYSSVTLSVDNNYLRMLGEIGLLGLVSFLAIFLSLGIYIKKTWNDIDSNLVKSFIIGFSAGVIGLALNAILIDVFEASKIAFVLWALVGIVLGIVTLYQKNKINLSADLKKIATSTYAIVLYIVFLGIVLFAPMLANYFVADDFTWFKWAATAPSSVFQYFSDAAGFFYRPGTKIYFYLMYHFFWLNQVVYHAVSLALHLGVAILFFILAKKIFKNVLLAAISAFIFVILSGYTEIVLWIAATGHLAIVFFGLLGLLCFIEWDQKRNLLYLVASIVSFSLALLFHEQGVVLPLLILVYKSKDCSLSLLKKTVKKWDFLILFIPVISYLILRFFANSHWQGGDYSYSLIKLPFNIAGNILGYLSLSLVGINSLSFYEALRNVTRVNILIPLVTLPIILIILYILCKRVFLKLEKEDKGIIVFGALFFLITLLPFLGLGNITSRYSYFASLGVVIILVFLIKKTYLYLLSNGKAIALSIVTLCVIVYSLFQIMQVQQSYFDWKGAGEKVRHFFISIDDLYNIYWAQPNSELHFVNVPIKYGDAWVFPVGLKDAVWFAFKNDQTKIYTHNDLDTALREVPYSPTNIILQFNDDGSVKEIIRNPKNPTEQVISDQN